MPKKSRKDVILERFEIAKKDSQERLATFNECDAVYHVKGKTQLSNAQIHNPYSWSNVETITPRMVAKRPAIIYRPREEGDDKLSDNLTALWDYWWDKDGAFTKVVAWVKDSLMYGTGLAKVYWRTEQESVTRYVLDEDPNSPFYGKPLVDEKGEFQTEKEQVTTFDDPCMEVVNIYNLFVDPQATSFRDAEWVIHRYWKTFQELKDAGYYKNLERLKDKLDGTKVERSSEDKYRHEQAGGLSDGEDSTVDRVECLEMWDRAGNLTVLAAGEVIIRDQSNPFWHGRLPFVRLLDSVVPHEFYGKGEIEPILPLQYALDTVQSMEIDNKTQVLQNMWKVTGDVDEEELAFRPNGVVHLNIGEDVESLAPPDMTQNAVAEMSNIKSDIQQALGIYDYTKGAESGVNKTATGVELIQEAANARFAHKIQLLEESLKELGYLVASLYQQFITDEKQIRILGEEGQEQTIRLRPADIAGAYDVDVEAGSTRPVNPEKDRQEALQLYQIFQGNPSPTFQHELQKEVLKTYDREKLTDALDQSFEEQQALQAVQAQEMAMQQEQQAAAQQEEMAMRGKEQEMKMMDAEANRQHQLELEAMRQEGGMRKQMASRMG